MEGARNPPITNHQSLITLHSPAESRITDMIGTRRRPQRTKLRCRQLGYARANRRRRRQAPFRVRSRLQIDAQRAAPGDLVHCDERFSLSDAVQFGRINVDIGVGIVR